MSTYILDALKHLSGKKSLATSCHSKDNSVPLFEVLDKSSAEPHGLRPLLY
jgi:hypothetical protein